MSKARWPRVTGTPCASSSRCSTNRRNGPNVNAPIISAYPRWCSTGCGSTNCNVPIAAVSTFIMQEPPKAAHQMVPILLKLGLSSEVARAGGQLGQLEWAAGILDAGDPRSDIPFHLDCNLHEIILAAPYMITLATASSRRT